MPTDSSTAVDAFCPECGSCEWTLDLEHDRAGHQTFCENCGEEMPVGDLRVNAREVLPTPFGADGERVYTVVSIYSEQLGSDIRKVTARNGQHAARLALAWNVGLQVEDDPDYRVDDYGEPEEAAGWIVAAVLEGACTEAAPPPIPTATGKDS